MKKSLILIGTMILVCNGLFSQVLFDFDINQTKKVKDGITLVVVQIVLKSDNSSVNYQLMPAGQLDGSPIQESGFTQVKRFEFKDIPVGKYIIKITDSENRTAFEQIVINEQ